MQGVTASGTSLAWAVPIFAEAAALGRSVAFAWLIGPEELGQVMILVLTLRLVEMSSDVGIDRLLLQAPDGESRTLQAGLHGATVLRGVIAAILVLACAPALAFVFQDGPSPMTYALSAIAPLVRGFAHLDYRRAERGFEYRWMFVVETGATIAMVLAILPAVWMLADHRSIVVVLITHAVTHTLLSHVVSQRGYQASFHPATLLRCWHFGAPLILNAGLMFLTFYADRMIVAKAYDWSSLALYGVVLQFALLPAQIIGRAASSLVLPRLRAVLHDRTFPAVWSGILISHIALAGAVGLGLAVVSPALIGMIYGDGLRPESALAAAVAVAAAFRIVRTPFSQLAIATARTADPARANVFRALALVPAALCAALGLPLVWIGAAAALGEAAATFRAYQLSRKSLYFGAARESLV